MRVAFTLVSKLVLPAMISVYYVLTRNPKMMIEIFRRRFMIPALLAFLVLANNISRSLSSVQEIVKRTKAELTGGEHVKGEKSVTCDVLCEPPPGEAVRADVIFIHGLHGSLVKTWRQGAWNSRKKHMDNVEVIRIKENSSFLQQLPPTLRRTVSLPVNCGCNFEKFDDAFSVSDLEPYQKSDHKLLKRSLSKCWPKDWLPQDCPGVRIIALNYTTDPYLWRPIWIKKRIRTSMQERAEEMLEHLLELGVGKQPIIWVAHSKGGLFVKQMLVEAWEKHQHNVQYQNCLLNNNISNIYDKMEKLCQRSAIYLQTQGIMFYSVPHRGSALADMNLPLLRQSIELTEIQKDCPGVLELHDKFMKLFENEQFDPEIFSFFETSLTLMSVLYLRIVAIESADPGVGEICGVPLDHRDICKPTSRDCLLYKELAALINRITNTGWN